MNENLITPSATNFVTIAIMAGLAWMLLGFGAQLWKKRRAMNGG